MTDNETRRSDRTRGSWLLVAALLVLAAVALFAERQRVVFEATGDFGRVRVTERAGVRTLHTGAGRARQSVIRPGRPLHLELPYTRVAAVTLGLIEPDSRILYVGLGGGAMPMHAHHVLPHATIDVVEIDPLIIEVAQRHFGFRPDSLLRVYADDGRRFIENAHAEAWDMIVLDAFSDDAIPYALATREFLLAVRSRLGPSGIVLSNLWTSNDAYASMLATWQDVFGDVHLLRVPDRRQVILLASRPPRTLERSSLIDAATRLETFGLQLAPVVRAGHLHAPASDAEVLVDSADNVPAQKHRSR